MCREYTLSRISRNAAFVIEPMEYRDIHTCTYVTSIAVNMKE